MEGRAVEFVWQINFTTVAVVTGWVASAIVGVVFLLRQNFVIDQLRASVEELREERREKGMELEEEDQRLRDQIAAVNASFSIFKEGVLRDHATRKDLQDQRTELSGFLSEMKREVLDSIGRVVTRVDSLHATIKQNGNH